MTRRPRDIGTAAETAVVKVARDNGFPMAMRLPLSGRLDKGDVLLNPGSGDPVYVEVKAGAKAKNASDNQIIKWLDEAVVAGGPGSYLVVVRERRSPAFWWAVRYSGTHVLFEWLEQAFKWQSRVLQYKASYDDLYGRDPLDEYKHAPTLLVETDENL